jgi:ATP-dependent 26S proteasome regulatory subunit
MKEHVSYPLHIIRALTLVLFFGARANQCMSTTVLETERSLQNNSPVGALPYEIQDLIEMLNNSRLNNGYAEDNVFINGLLIHGPDGNGKTTLAHIIAERTGAKLIELPGSFFATNTYDNARRLTKTFSEIEEYAKKNNQPVILLIDDAGVVKDHITQGNLWCKLDDIRDDSRILVILTTNEYLGIYDARLLSRMRHLEVKNPNYEQRLELLQLYIKDKSFDSESLQELAEESANFSIKELKESIESVSAFAQKEDTLSLDKDLLLHKIHSIQNKKTLKKLALLKDKMVAKARSIGPVVVTLATTYYILKSSKILPSTITPRI